MGVGNVQGIRKGADGWAPGHTLGTGRWLPATGCWQVGLGGGARWGRGRQRRGWGGGAVLAASESLKCSSACWCWCWWWCSPERLERGTRKLWGESAALMPGCAFCPWLLAPGCQSASQGRCTGGQSTS